MAEISKTQETNICGFLKYMVPVIVSTLYHLYAKASTATRNKMRIQYFENQQKQFVKTGHKKTPLFYLRQTEAVSSIIWLDV